MNSIIFFENEQWRWVVGYQNHYKVSNYGRVMSYKRNVAKLRALIKNPDGYLYLKLLKPGQKTKYGLVHQLVADAFIQPNYDRRKYQPHHINHIRTDNRLENLVLLTIKEHRSKESANRGKPLSPHLIAKREQTKRQKRLLDPNYDKPWSKTPKLQRLQ